MTGDIAEAMFGMPRRLETDERGRLQEAGLLDSMKLFESACDVMLES